MTTTLTRRRFTVEQYHLMGQAGILTEDDRVELLDGEVVEKVTIGPRHADCVDGLTSLLVRTLGASAHVRVQGPVVLPPHSEPEPDLALLRPRTGGYRSSHPSPPDVLLVIEVADTSAETDRAIKVPLYAAAGIPEAWLVDLAAETLTVYREPTPQGYRLALTLRRGDVASPLAFPDVRLPVEQILG